MADIADEIRAACAWVAGQSRHVHIEIAAMPTYAESLPLSPGLGGADPDVHLSGGSREQRAAFWLTLDAINFGSGWFPTLRKRRGQSGYHMVAGGITDQFAAHGPWSAQELQALTGQDLAAVLGQDAGHELMGLFATSLRDLGAHIARDAGGSFAAAVDAAAGSAVALAERLSTWSCFADASEYAGRRVPFLKRAQIAAADLARAGAAAFGDLHRLTMFADNLVPHVLRLDGVLRFDSGLVRRIEAGDLIAHGSPEEVEIRACALYAVELRLDPLWDGGSVEAVPSTDSLAGTAQTALGLSIDESSQTVDVAGYSVGFDESRGLWYCDIVFGEVPAYTPFVRLALARYQPSSIPGVELSHVVLADFAQLAPDRSASLALDPATATQARLVVGGVAPGGPAESTVTVTVERRVGEIGSDLGWTPAAPDVASATEDTPAPNQPDSVLWSGTISFAAEPPPGQFRVVVREFEVTGTIPGTASYSRMVYAAILPFDFPATTGAST